MLNCLSNIYLGDETLSTTLRAGTAVTLNLKAQELVSHEIYDLSQETYRAVSLSDEENIGDCLHFKEKIQAMALETCENQRWSHGHHDEETDVAIETETVKNAAFSNSRIIEKHK